MEVWRDLTDDPQVVMGSTRDAPQVVLDAIAENVKAGGVRALHSDAVLGRLRSLSARQVVELSKRRPLRDHDISLHQLRALYGGNQAWSQADNRATVNSIAGRTEHRPAYVFGLRALSGTELLSIDLLPREVLLSPWLPAKGLAMIHAERGIGKTWVAMNTAHALNTAGEYLGWRGQRPCRVAYLDGEMPTAVLQERYATIVASAPSPDRSDDEDLFRLVAADYQRDGLPDLADPDGQGFFDDVINDADVIILDNLSTLCRSLKENDADSWGPVQAWCLKQRAAGRSVILVHHGGKSGGQRGTSRKEDVLDTVIALRRPPDYDAQQGARFEVHYTKARGFFGESAQLSRHIF